MIKWLYFKLKNFFRFKSDCSKCALLKYCKK